MKFTLQGQLDQTVAQGQDVKIGHSHLHLLLQRPATIWLHFSRLATETALAGRPIYKPSPFFSLFVPQTLPDREWNKQHPCRGPMPVTKQSGTLVLEEILEYWPGFYLSSLSCRPTLLMYSSKFLTHPEGGRTDRCLSDSSSVPREVLTEAGSREFSLVGSQRERLYLALELCFPKNESPSLDVC